MRSNSGKCGPMKLAVFQIKIIHILWIILKSNG